MKVVGVRGSMNQIIWKTDTRDQRIAFLLVFFLLVLSQMAINAEKVIGVEERPHVLVLSSYNSSFPTFFDQLDGIRSELPESHYDLDIEQMDTKRFGSKDNIDRFNQRLTDMFQKGNTYDLIIAADDNALLYVREHMQDLFKDVPIVFLGINDEKNAKEAFDTKQATGVQEVVSMKDTIDLAVNQVQGINELLIITDGTWTGQAELRHAMEFQWDYPTVTFDVADLSEITYNQLAQRLEGLNNHSSILLLSAYSDVNGTTLTFYEYLEHIMNHTNRPIYHAYGFGIGQGILGGKVVDFVEHGVQAGRMGKRILEGEEPSSIPIVQDTSVNSYMFDYNLLDDYGLSLSSLPEKSVIVHAPVSIFTEYKNIVMTSLAILGILIAFIILLLMNLRYRHRVAKDLQNSNEELTALYEELMAMNEELEASEEELREINEALLMKNQIIEESEERYKYVFELSQSGLWERNIGTEQLYLTTNWYLRLLANTIDGKNFIGDDRELWELFRSRIEAKQLVQLENYLNDLSQGLRSQYTLVLECCYEDDRHYVEEIARGVYNNDGELIKIVGSHTDITASVEYERQLQDIAYKDQLTSMPNRIVLERALDDYIHQSTIEQPYGCLLMIDIDNFKFVNNTYGHEVGDALLKEIGKRLVTAEKDAYTIGRISGDEFVILCRGLHNKTKIEAFVKELMDLFEERFIIYTRSIYITLSIGIALFPENGMTFDMLINRGNNALFDAKIKGKNRFEYYDVTLNDMMDTRIFIQNNLREAIINKKFEMYYQPQYDMNSNQIVGFEALIRWKDEERGFISPLEFIVVAEKTGLINVLGKWIYKEAATFAKHLVTHVNPSLYVSVNVSSVQLLQNDFVETIKSITTELDVPYEAICLEITETALMQSFEKNAEKLRKLRQLGAMVSLDDFGTGYSSLSYLRRLPVDFLKIDKSFIDELLVSEEDRNLTEGIIMIAQKMGMKVIAEGIEEKEQMDCLKSFGCDAIQGYYLSKALPQNKAIEFFKSFDTF